MDNKPILECTNNLIEELNKFEKMLRSGNVSNSNIKNAKAKGILRDSSKFMDGIERGNKAILKKFGATDDKWSLLAALIGPHARPKLGGGHKISTTGNWGGLVKLGWSMMINKKISKLEWKQMMGLLRRHEVDEVRSMNYNKKDQTNFHFVNPKNKSAGNPDGTVGRHASPRVLKREKELLDFTTKAYNIGNPLAKMRKLTGEDDFIKNLSYKEIKKLEKKSNKHGAATWASGRVNRKKFALEIRRLFKGKSNFNKVIDAFKKAKESTDNVPLYKMEV
jgi:hypothetical protein